VPSPTERLCSALPRTLLSFWPFTLQLPTYMSEASSGTRTHPSTALRPRPPLLNGCWRAVTHWPVAARRWAARRAPLLLQLPRVRPLQRQQLGAGAPADGFSLLDPAASADAHPWADWGRLKE
jgi:hypothetical protein